MQSNCKRLFNKNGLKIMASKQIKESFSGNVKQQSLLTVILCYKIERKIMSCFHRLIQGVPTEKQIKCAGIDKL